MRGLLAHLLVDIAVAGAIVAMVSPAGSGLAGATAEPARDPGAVQIVDRTNKGDRLRRGLRGPEVGRRAPVMQGCETVYSPLAISTAANYSGRCVT